MGGGGGLKSLAPIFSPLLDQKSSGFVRILLFLPENGYLKNYRGGGGGGAAAPLAAGPIRLWLLQFHLKVISDVVLFINILIM